MSLISDLLKDIPLSAVLRERVKSMDADIERLREENANLEKDKAQLLKENKKLMDELSKMKTSAKNFVEYHGAKFRKLPDGSYDKTVVYCYHCESPMTAISNNLPFECSRCGYTTDFRKRDLTMTDMLKALK